MSSFKICLFDTASEELTIVGSSKVGFLNKPIHSAIAHKSGEVFGFNFGVIRVAKDQEGKYSAEMIKSSNTK